MAIDFVNDPIENIAKQLLGCIIEHEVNGKVRSGIIVDTEIYMGDQDQASHAYNGKRTPRMQAMLLEGGHLYLYQMRGHVLMNFVCGKAGEVCGIMIRAIEPLEGIEDMILDRKQNGPSLTNGPGKLTQALGITMNLYGSAIGGALKLIEDTPYRVNNMVTTSRIGIPNKGGWTHAPLRFYVDGNPYCSDIKSDTIRPDHGWLKV